MIKQTPQENLYQTIDVIEKTTEALYTLELTNHYIRKVDYSFIDRGIPLGTAPEPYPEPYPAFTPYYPKPEPIFPRPYTPPHLAPPISPHPYFPPRQPPYKFTY